MLHRKRGGGLYAESLCGVGPGAGSLGRLPGAPGRGALKPSDWGQVLPPRREDGCFEEASRL